jgi:hypothetical protein
MVLARTVESYCRQTHALLAIVGLESSSRSVQADRPLRDAAATPWGSMRAQRLDLGAFLRVLG